MISGKANKVGYYYDPASDFEIKEAGIYEVYVQVTHQGATSAGNVEAPFPNGGILEALEISIIFMLLPKKVKQPG